MSIKEMGNLPAALGYPSPRVKIPKRTRGLEPGEEQMVMKHKEKKPEFMDKIRSVVDRKGLGDPYSECERLVTCIALYMERAERLVFTSTEDFSEDEHNMINSRLEVIAGRVMEMLEAYQVAAQAGGNVEMQSWMKDKLTLAADYVTAVADTALHGGGLEIEFEGPTNINMAEVKKPDWKGRSDTYKKGLSKDEVESAKRASVKSQKAPRTSDKALEQWPSDKAHNKRLKKSGRKMPKGKGTKAYHRMFGNKEDHAEKQEKRTMPSPISAGEFAEEKPGNNRMAYLQGLFKEKNPGLWANINAKRKRGERMRKKGEKGAPSEKELKRAQETSRDHSEKADKDYDGDGKIESGKDEYWGSIQNAKKKREKAEKAGISVDSSEMSQNSRPRKRAGSEARHIATIDNKEHGGEKHEKLMSKKTRRIKDKRTRAIVEGLNALGFEESEDFSAGALKEKSEKSGIPLGILRSVYSKGVAAWKTGHRPGTTAQQWAHARVNSFISGSGGARKADADLWKRAKAARGRKKK